MDEAPFGSTDYWLSRTRALVGAFDDALRERGYQLDHDLRVVADPRSMYCYYDADERLLAMGYPDLGQFFGQMRWATYRPLFGTEGVEETARAAAALLPVLAVHEAAHHLRHRYGRMKRDDPWTEEHAVNILTVGYLRTLPRWPAEAPGVLAQLDRVRHHSAQLHDCDYVDATHDDLDEVLLHAMKAFDRVAYDQAFLAAEARGVPVHRVLLDAGLVTPELVAEAERRQHAARERFNEEYSRHFMASTILSITQLQVELVDRDLPPFTRGLAELIGPPTLDPVP